MSLAKIVTLAIELENLVGEIYRLAANLSPEDNTGQELARLANEEQQHVNLLRTGRNYLTKAPEVFGQPAISEEEMLLGLKKAQELLVKIENRKLLLPQMLEELRELERELEKIHLNTLVETKDESLKKLFRVLAGEDEKHVERLEQLLENFK
jgi:rubrerythrin